MLSRGYNICYTTSMTNWLSTNAAAKRFGYSSAKSLRRRIQQLRAQGQVEDLGDPPVEYRRKSNGRLKIFWVNSVTMMVDASAPPTLLDSKVGRR